MANENNDVGGGKNIWGWVAAAVVIVMIIAGVAMRGNQSETTGVSGTDTSTPVASSTQSAATEETAPSATKIATTAKPTTTKSTTKTSDVVAKNTSPVPPAAATPPAPLPPAKLESVHPSGDLKLSIPGMTAGDNHLPLPYTCYRANTSPPLQWQGAPHGTRSFAIFMVKRVKDKPDFATWIAFDIPGDAKGLAENLPKQADAAKDGTKQALSDLNASSYVGPCDPQGKFDYVFRLFALDTKLNVNGGASKDDVIRAMNGHILDEGDLAVVHYLRF